ALVTLPLHDALPISLLQPPAPRSDFAAAAAQGAPSTEPVDTLAPLRAALVAAGATRVTAEAIDAARVAARLATAGRDGGPGVLRSEEHTSELQSREN